MGVGCDESNDLCMHEERRIQNRKRDHSYGEEEQMVMNGRRISGKHVRKKNPIRWAPAKE